MIDKSSTSLTFTWDTPRCRDRGGEITSFYYQLKGLNTTTMEGNVTDNMVVLLDLTPSTEYAFQVSATTSVGRGPFTAEIEITTDDLGNV